MDIYDDPILESVVEQIKKDFVEQDETALYELLSFLPKRRLLGYLPEETQQQLLKQKTNG
jgi:hypothetical protein